MERPDVWEIIKITDHVDNISMYRILAGWYGGYLGSNSWKINSGIVSCKLTENGWYEFQSVSGTVYLCHRDVRRMSSLTAGIYENLRQESDEPSSRYTVALVADDPLTINYS